MFLIQICIYYTNIYMHYIFSLSDIFLLTIWESLGYHSMALSTSDSDEIPPSVLIRGMAVEIFKDKHLKYSVSLSDVIGKSKEMSQNIRKRTEQPQVWIILGYKLVDTHGCHVQV